MSLFFELQMSMYVWDLHQKINFKKSTDNCRELVCSVCVVIKIVDSFSVLCTFDFLIALSTIG